MLLLPSALATHTRSPSQRRLPTIAKPSRDLWLHGTSFPHCDKGSQGVERTREGNGYSWEEPGGDDGEKSGRQTRFGDVHDCVDAAGRQLEQASRGCAPPRGVRIVFS